MKACLGLITSVALAYLAAAFVQAIQERRDVDQVITEYERQLRELV